MPNELDQMLSNLANCWAIAYRRRWWILIPVILTWASVWGISWVLPSTYQSEALILLKQQNVPNQFVTPNVNDSAQDRLQTISQQILSRTRLQATIDRYHLYPEPHGLRILLLPGDPIDHMRRDIEIELVPVQGHPDESEAFKLRYTAESPKLAQQVNEDLASPFFNENVEAQQQLSQDTTSFLATQLADARTKMEEQEAKVASFKAKHLQELPSQLEMNVQQILTGIQSRLQDSHQNLESARQHKLYLQSLLHQYQSLQPNQGNAPSEGVTTHETQGSTVTTGKALEEELTDLRLRLQDLQERYTDEHPDVVALKDKIEKKEKIKRRLESELTVSPSSRKATNATDSAAMKDERGGSSASVVQLEMELEANEREIQNYQKHESDLESQVSAYLAGLKMAPETEQKLADISRDYEESKANYNSLLQKQMQSQLATSLEEKQKGEQFRVLDPPSFPKKHVAPNRFKFSCGGVALGFVLGLGLVAVLELRNIRIWQEKDLKEVVSASLLVSIPHLSTQSEEDKRAIATWLDLGAVTILVTLIAAGNIYAFFRR